MSDALRKKGESLISDLVKDVKDKQTVVKKIKAMSKLAKDIGESTEEVDNAISAIEAFSDMVIKRFDKSAKKE